MTRSILHHQYSDLLMNIQAWGADIGIGAHSIPNSPIVEQEVYAIVVTKLDRLTSERKNMIEKSGLIVDVIDLDNKEIILLPPTVS